MSDEDFLAECDTLSQQREEAARICERMEELRTTLGAFFVPPAPRRQDDDDQDNSPTV
jgi:hypothetical protein